MNKQIQVLTLGAGQDIGRSCIIVTFETGRTVMLDCGAHMGSSDARKFPDFSQFSANGGLDSLIDCVLITHLHLDHCGALPYMTERVGYSGPVIMSHPTKAICPTLLSDFCRISGHEKRNNDKEGFSQADIANSLAKARIIQVHETISIAPDLQVKAYYAGHVLGAVMFLVTSGSQSVLYTGDFNMTPDRHLGVASVDKCRPDILITESTCANMIRDSKRSREGDLQRKIVESVRAGGNVLIPVFAVGRAQELAIILESTWERLNIPAPIYFAGGMTLKTSEYYRLFVSWTTAKMHKTLVEYHQNPFDFKHIKPLDDLSALSAHGGMVVFSSPGMLHSGLSLEIFKKWADDPKNLVVLSGYCAPGTVGAQLLQPPNAAGERHVQFEHNGPTKCVSIRVESLGFSAHADAKGICQLVRDCEPKNVMLVHGEVDKMSDLKATIESRIGIKTYMPANHEMLEIETAPVQDLEPSVLFTPALVKAANSRYHRMLSTRTRQVIENKGDVPWIIEAGIKQVNVPMRAVYVANSTKKYFTTPAAIKDVAGVDSIKIMAELVEEISETSDDRQEKNKRIKV